MEALGVADEVDGSGHFGRACVGFLRIILSRGRESVSLSAQRADRE